MANRVDIETETAKRLCEIRGYDPNEIVAFEGRLAKRWESLIPSVREHMQMELAYRQACIAIENRNNKQQ